MQMETELWNLKCREATIFWKVSSISNIAENAIYFSTYYKIIK